MIDDLAYLPLIVDTGGIPVVLIENKNSNLGNAIMHLSLSRKIQIKSQLKAPRLDGFLKLLLFLLLLFSMFFLF